jgi:hypothetical protein
VIAHIGGLPFEEMLAPGVLVMVPAMRLAIARLMAYRGRT